MVKLGTGLGLLHGVSLRRWGPYCVSKYVASRCYHRARAWCTRMECIGAPLFLTRLALLQSLTLCASVLWLGSVSLIFLRNPFTWPVLVTHVRVETRIGFYAGCSFLSGCRGLEHVCRTSWLVVHISLCMRGGCCWLRRSRRGFLCVVVRAQVVGVFSE
jgi:hypothetical protein